MSLVRAVPVEVVESVVAWTVVVWTTPRYWHGRRDIRLSAFWYTELLLAFAFTCEVPIIYLGIDHLLHLPNAARWLSNACALGAAYMLDTFFFALAHGARRLQWHRPWLLISLAVTLVAMAVLLASAHLQTDSTTFDLAHVIPAVVAYHIVYVGFFGFVVVRLIVHAIYYYRHAPDTPVKVGMALLVLGGTAGLAYLVFNLAVALTPTSSPWAQPFQRGVSASLLVGVVSVGLGASVPEWGKLLGVARWTRHLRTIQAYWRLQPLWRRLTQARPEVVLPTAVAIIPALIRPQHVEFLLQRRVIEILDARRLLLTGHEPVHTEGARPMMGGRDTETARRIEQPNPSTREHGAAVAEAPHMTNVAGDIPATHNTPGAWQRTRLPEKVEQLAQEEAQLLRIQLASLTRGNGTLPSPLELFQPATYEESIVYLERVAAALKTPSSHFGRHVMRRQASQSSQERRHDFGQQSPA